MLLQPGEQIGDYIIVKKIGEGGMSVVYLAEHKEQRTTQVVVKQLKEHLAFDKQLVDRFVLSAEIMRQLRHPHLARVLDYMERDGGYFMVEEYLSGGSLADLIDRREVISEKQALCWCRDALHAVNYAHENRIVHRDLKPNNLMLNEEREVKVTDFGIAKVFGGTRRTKTGEQMGTTVYMSPEQIRSPSQIDHLADVYSMGVVLYELLTGRIPFDGQTDFEIMQAVVQKSPVPPRRLNPRVSPQAERIVLKALQKRAEDRFDGCGDFAIEIDRLIRPTNQKGKRPSPNRKHKLIQSIKRHWLIATGSIFLLFLAIRFVPGFFPRPQDPVGTRAQGTTPIDSPPPTAEAKGNMDLNPIPWAEVVSIKSVDGKDADIDLRLPAPTPVRIAVPPGEYSVRLRTKRGDMRDEKLTIKSGETLTWAKPVGGFEVESAVNELLR